MSAKKIKELTEIRKSRGHALSTLQKIKQ